LIGRRRRNWSIVIPGGMSHASYMNPSEATWVDTNAVVADAVILIPATRPMHAQAPHDLRAEDRAGIRGGLPKWNRLPNRPPVVPCPHAHRVARRRAVSVPRRSLLGALVRASRTGPRSWLLALLARYAIRLAQDASRRAWQGPQSAPWSGMCAPGDRGIRGETGWRRSYVRLTPTQKVKSSSQSG
jgi:hypothetical protein